MKGNEMDKMSAIRKVNAAYMAEDYDRYDDLIERFSKSLGIPAWQFEDDCTDVRMFGEESNG